jgi:hypothetical protein
MENDLLSAKFPYIKASHVGILRLVTFCQRRYSRSKTSLLLRCYLSTPIDYHGQRSITAHGAWSSEAVLGSVLGEEAITLDYLQADR